MRIGRRWLLGLLPACLMGQEKPDRDVVLEAAEAHARKAVDEIGSAHEYARAFGLQAKLSFLAGVVWQREQLQPKVEAFRLKLDEMRRQVERQGKR